MTTARYRTIWLSDTHLGTRGCQAGALVDFLDRHECEYLYLVGDVIDFWQLKRAPFWPQLSANGYYVDQRMAPNVYTSAGSTMARNYQVFNNDWNRDANVTAMYPLFSGGRDYYAYRAASRRADAWSPGAGLVRGIGFPAPSPAPGIGAALPAPRSPRGA